MRARVLVDLRGHGYQTARIQRKPVRYTLTAEAGWLRASSETRSMMPVELSRESNAEANGKTGRAGEVQPAICQELSLAGGLPAVLDLSVSWLGQPIPSRMVY